MPASRVPSSRSRTSRHAMRGRALFTVLVLASLSTQRAHTAPAVPYHVPVIGVARDADDAIIPSGNLVIRIFPDSIGGSALYDSGSEFNGEIVKGIFDVVAGRSTPL